MKGYTFYAEIPEGTKRYKVKRANVTELCHNVMAVINGTKYIGRSDIMSDAFGGLTDTPNSYVCSTGVSMGYLRDNCIRISEKQARQIHPEMFRLLDSD